MYRNFIKIENRGFTIIETMVAVALFLVVVLTGMDALLNANLVHQKSQDMRSIMDSLNFIMDDMSKNMRTGSGFHCINDNFASSLVTLRSCVLGAGIAFEGVGGNSSDPNDQWAYNIRSDDGGQTYNIWKSVDAGTTWVQLNTAEVILNPISGFSILGAEATSSGDQQQPLVIIKLVGKVLLKNSGYSPFSIQTTVSQRLIDR